LVGARLISHAGSLMNLAKHPASTVQILGAEKALFRALKTKHDTPKYGLIYHASLIGQAPPKLKGKMARMVATKAALSIRVDALTDVDGKSEPMAPSIGLENRAKLESRLRALEYADDLGGGQRPMVKKQQRFEMSGGSKVYNTAADAVDMLPTDRDPTAAAMTAVLEVKAEKQKEKEEKKEKKKKKKAEKDGDDDSMAGKGSHSQNGVEESGEKKTKKKREKEAAPGTANGEATSTQVSKKRSLADIDSNPAEGESRKKKKKKKEQLD